MKSKTFLSSKAHDILNLNKFVTPAFICLFVAALHYFCLPQTRRQLGSIDPYLYTSLSLNYEELLGRFGPTYYATRLAAIAPISLFYQLFGFEFGFLLLRVLHLRDTPFF